MREERASQSEIEWLQQYAKVSALQDTTVEYVPLLMSLPLLGECSDIFVRQVVTMKPPVWDILSLHVKTGDSAWALPAARVKELKLCSARADADAHAIWAALTPSTSLPVPAAPSLSQ